MLFLTVSTAFAAMPVSDGIDVQHDVSMFDQIPAIEFQRKDVDTAMSADVEPMHPQNYEQITTAATADIYSGVAVGADAVNSVGCFNQAITCSHGDSFAVDQPDNAV